MRALAIGCSILAAVAAVSTPCFAQSLEVGGGAVSLEAYRVEARVEEGFASVEVVETFRNATDVAREGVWRFRLPADAVVGSFSMWMAGREKSGRVLEAERARAVYDAIVHRRQDPALLEQEGWRDFRVSVFPIPARDTVRVRLRYSHPLRDDLGVETFEVPLPVGCGSVGEARVRAVIEAAHGLESVDCPTHRDAKLVRGETCAEATWSSDGVPAAKSFVLRAVPRRRGFDVAVLAHRAPGADDGYFVARVVPRLAEPPRIPRDVVFVVDRSGSMEGRKIAQARAALLAGLGTLRAGDRFDVVSFASDVTSLGAGRLLDATVPAIERARGAARDLVASGGTNIAGALDAALAARDHDASRLYVVVFLTDGDPTVGERDPERLLAAWRARSAGEARLFAFGVGADVKEFLLTKLASEGRGEAVYLADDADLEVKVASLVGRLRTPLLIDPEMSIDAGPVAITDREPRRLPDVFQDRALLVAGRFHGTGTATLHLRGRSGSESVSIDVPIEFASSPVARPHVAQMWAKLRIERLLDDLRIAGPNPEIRREIVRLSLAHQVVTPYTSFLVVEDGVRIADPGETGRVPEEDGPHSPSGGGAMGGSSFGRSGGSGGGEGSGGGSSGSSGGDVDAGEKKSGDGGGGSGGTDAGGGSSGGGGAGKGKGASAQDQFLVVSWFFEHNREQLFERLVGPQGALRRPSLAPADRDRIFDALAHQLAAQESMVRDAAVVALGKLGTPQAVELLRAQFAKEQARDVRQDVLIALGLTRDESVIPILDSAIQNDRSGHFTSYALLGLGLTRNAEKAGPIVLRCFTNWVRTAAYDRGGVDPAASAAVALGALRFRDAERPLIAALADKDVVDVVRCYCAQALGHLGGDAARDALVSAMQRSSLEVERAAAVALGNFIEAGVARALQGRAGIGAGDPLTAGLAAVSLGRVLEALPANERRVAVDSLKRTAFAPEKSGVRAQYATLALTFLGAFDRETSTWFAHGLADVKLSSDVKSALAMTAGLSGLEAVKERLLKVARDGGTDPRCRSYAAMAFAMVGRRPDAESALALRDLCDSTPDTNVRRGAVMGLGFVGGGSDVPLLLRVIEMPEEQWLDHYTRGAAVVALGMLRDPESVGKLLDLTGKPDSSTRAFALAALGCMVDKDPAPAVSRLFSDADFRSKFATLEVVMRQL